MPARTPQDVDRLFGECVNAADLDALVALYEPDASLVQQDGNVVRGTAAIRESLKALPTARAKIEMHVVSVVEGGRDLAVLFNDWSMSAMGPDGKPVELVGKALEVVRRQADETWRFAIDDPLARSR